jgi:hypothetical protein
MGRSVDGVKGRVGRCDSFCGSWLAGRLRLSLARGLCWKGAARRGFEGILAFNKSPH